MLHSESGPVSNNLRFPGQYDDRLPNTSLYYNWYRFYNPITGRYHQGIIYDTMLGDNLDVYFYADSNSIIFIDPKGRCPATLSPKKCCEEDIQKEIKKCDDKYNELLCNVDWWRGPAEYLRHFSSAMDKCKKNPSWQTCGYNSCGDAAAMFLVWMEGCAGPCCELELTDLSSVPPFIRLFSKVLRPRFSIFHPYHTVIDLICQSKTRRTYDPYWQQDPEEPSWADFPLL